MPQFDHLASVEFSQYRCASPEFESKKAAQTDGFMSIVDQLSNRFTTIYCLIGGVSVAAGFGAGAIVLINVVGACGI